MRLPLPREVCGHRVLLHAATGSRGGTGTGLGAPTSFRGVCGAPWSGCAGQRTKIKTGSAWLLVLRWWAWAMDLKNVLLGIFGAAAVSRVTGLEAIRFVHQSSAIPPATSTSIPLPLPRPRQRRHLETFRADGAGGDADSLVVHRAGLYLQSLLCCNRWSQQQQKQHQQQHRCRPREAGRKGSGGQQGAEDTASTGGIWPLASVRRLG